jgi:drug/metabolite transporter (DMT)-like permease
MEHIKKETLGTYGLVLVSLFWGLGFPALKVVSESIPTFYLIAIRFFIVRCCSAFSFLETSEK